MRKLILFLLFCISLNVIGQKSSSAKDIDITTIGTLLAKKATVSQAIQMLGEPIEQIANPERTLLQYENENNLYALKFDKDKKLYDFVFINKSKNPVDKIGYETVKQARDVKTKKEINSKLGLPSQISANGDIETWYYTFEGNKVQKTLIVRFDLTNPEIVKSYSYTIFFNNEKAVSSLSISDLVVGSSTNHDVENKLGNPSQLILDKDQEKWYYLNPQSTLLVYFDKQSKVNDYVYHKGSNND